MCEYRLEYTVKEKDRDAYFHQRNQFLKVLPASDSEFQAPIFEILPGDKCVQRGKYLEFGTKGSGAFGWVAQGVDITTGDPIAIKEIRITSEAVGAEIMHEVAMGGKFVVG